MPLLFFTAYAISVQLFIMGCTLLVFTTLDCVIVAFAAFFFILGCRKGFLRSLISVAGVAFVSYIGPSVSNSLSNTLYDKFFAKKVLSVTEEVFENNIAGDVCKKRLDKTLRNLDPISSTILKRSGACSLKTFLNGASSKEMLDSIVKKRSLKYLNFIISVGVTSVLFVLLKFLLRRFSLKNLPVIGSVDSVLGGAFGLFEFLVFIFVLFNIFNLLYSFNSYTNGSNAFFSNIINKSISFKFLKEINIWNFVK